MSSKAKIAQGRGYLGKSVTVVEDTLREGLALPKGAKWGLVAVDLETGKEVLQVGSAVNGMLSPGSVMKIFTTGAALESDPAMETVIATVGTAVDGVLDGSISLKGRGNALLSCEDLRKGARKLWENGIRAVTGDVVVDATTFDTAGMERTRKGAGHAPAGALGVDLHTVAVTVTPSRPGEPPKVSAEPPLASIRFAVSARTVSSRRESVTVTQFDDLGFRIEGEMPAGSGPRKWRFPVSDPSLVAGEALRTALRGEGVEVRGAVRKGRVPPVAVTVHAVPSPGIDRMVRETNVHSLNVLADNLFLSLAAVAGEPVTCGKAEGAMKRFLRKVGMPDEGIAIGDGSGLSDGNRVSARYVAEYLRRAAMQPWGERFRASLPRAGYDGTLRDIGYRNESFRAKSGRLENVFALAGYGVDPRGRKIAFAYLANVPAGGERLPLERGGAEVMRHLATH